MVLPASMPSPLLTLGEFLDLEQQAEDKHELSQGRIVAMAGASPNHVRITPRLSLLCGNALQDSRCEYLDQDLKIVVEASNSVYYPDGAIACPPHFTSETVGAIDNPKVIFEVLSPSTEARDRGEKHRNYALLPSLQDYVLIDSAMKRVEVFTRQSDDSWILRAYIEGSSASVPSVNLELPLDVLYERAEFPTHPAAPDSSAAASDPP